MPPPGPTILDWTVGTARCKQAADGARDKLSPLVDFCPSVFRPTPALLANTTVNCAALEPYLYIPTLIDTTLTPCTGVQVEETPVHVDRISFLSTGPFVALHTLVLRSALHQLGGNSHVRV
jgi:hypothetical protein